MSIKYSMHHKHLLRVTLIVDGLKPAFPRSGQIRASLESDQIFYFNSIRHDPTKLDVFFSQNVLMNNTTQPRDVDTFFLIMPTEPVAYPVTT